ncbi:MAG: transketolase [Candidatus Krumholzibacteria bacterium]|nr:transketolase [Candidatus Krumholzibacteria bacterium]
MSSVDERCINTIRFLAVDAVEKARSGHPGMPLGAAPMAYVLWDRFLRHNPANPNWFDRDRFVLSAGHGSALIYALLHLFGYDLPMKELREFRQWQSKTAGHPEHGLTPGIEVTTGPLGQGFAMGVGMAIAEAFLTGVFNPPPGEDAVPMIDHYTYAIVSDGDLMEGVASEAASLAGHLKLGKLIYLYDDNHISIDGRTELAFTEDVALRFDAYGWHVQSVGDGNDIDAIETAIQRAQDEKEKPSLICVRTHIGYGSPKQDSASAHGEPLGTEATMATKDKLNWPNDKAFYVPEDVRDHFGQALARGQEAEDAWEERFAMYRERHPEKAGHLEKAIRGRLPEDWDAEIPVFDTGGGEIATRKASGMVLNAVAKRLPTLIGGSADLSGSNQTFLKDLPQFSAKDRTGRNLHFGVREHAMGAILNGMARHGGVVPYGGTFLVFSDYMRPAIRIAALMQAPSIFVFTHDSVGLGEDGPTHQPIEHLASLRAVPGLTLIRPADANETAAAWRVAIQHPGPVALALTRQGLPVLDPERHPIALGVAKGAYILSEAPTGVPDVVLLASGSEVSLVVMAQQELGQKGVGARVVSMPCWELFDQQTDSYRQDVLPPNLPKLVVEAGSPQGWREYIGDKGGIVGIDRFGASAPGKMVLKKLGFHVDRIVAEALTLVGQ